MIPRWLLLVLVLASAGCNRTASTKQPSRLSEAQVLAIAKPAIEAMFPGGWPQNQPYRAELRDGVWHVFGSLPPNTIGGTPEARIRDRDGKVLEVFHTQ